MKKLFFLAALFLALGTIAESCKKDDPEPEPQTNGNDTDDVFTLSDEGVTFVSPGLIKQHSDGFITIAAAMSFTAGYGLAIADTLNAGTYNLVPISPVQLTKTENSGSVNYTQQTGTLVITAHDKTAHTISGTFSGTLMLSGGSQTRTITNGAFDFNY